MCGTRELPKSQPYLVPVPGPSVTLSTVVPRAGPRRKNSIEVNLKFGAFVCLQSRITHAKGVCAPNRRRQSRASPTT